MPERMRLNKVNSMKINELKKIVEMIFSKVNEDFDQ